MKSIAAVTLTAALVFPVLPFSFLQAQEASRSAGRLAPPPELACDRNNLTSYYGVISKYCQQSGRLELVIDTDYGTRESVVIEFSDDKSPRDFYLLNGRPFQDADMTRIEAEPGVLRDGIRVIAWICEDGATPPVIDWRPARSD